MKQRAVRVRVVLALVLFCAAEALSGVKDENPDIAVYFCRAVAGSRDRIGAADMDVCLTIQDSLISPAASLEISSVPPRPLTAIAVPLDWERAEDSSPSIVRLIRRGGLEKGALRLRLSGVAAIGLDVRVHSDTAVAKRVVKIGYSPPPEDRLAVVLHFPPIVTAGEDIVATPFPDFTTGAWNLIVEDQVVPGEWRPADETYAFRHVVFSLPNNLATNSPIGLEYTNAVGYKSVRVPLGGAGRIADGSNPPSPPGIAAVGTVAPIGGALCGYGWFPTSSFVPNLQMEDGAKLRVLATSRGSILFNVPLGTQPGRHQVLVAPRLSFEAIRLYRRERWLHLVGTRRELVFTAQFGESFVLMKTSSIGKPLRRPEGVGELEGRIVAVEEPCPNERGGARSQGSDDSLSADRGSVGDAVDVQLAVSVGQLLDKFRRERGVLVRISEPSGVYVRRIDVLRLLEKAEEGTLSKLQTPNLLALHAFVRDEMRAARMRLAEDAGRVSFEKGRVQQLLFVESSGVREPRREVLVSWEAANSVLDRADEIIVGVVRRSGRLRIDACVVSWPDRAEVKYSPKSDTATQTLTALTNVVLRSLWIGRYVYGVKWKEGKSVRGIVDFLDDSQSTLECYSQVSPDNPNPGCSLGGRRAADVCRELRAVR